MTLTWLADRDSAGELLGWLAAIGELVESTAYDFRHHSYIAEN